MDITLKLFDLLLIECSGSVVECLTRDRRAAGSSLTGVRSLSKTHIYPSLVLVQPRKTRPYITERLLMGRKESKQTTLIDYLKFVFGNMDIDAKNLTLLHAKNKDADQPAVNYKVAKMRLLHLQIITQRVNAFNV